MLLWILLSNILCNCLCIFITIITNHNSPSVLLWLDNLKRGTFFCLVSSGYPKSQGRQICNEGLPAMHHHYFHHTPQGSFPKLPIFKAKSIKRQKKTRLSWIFWNLSSFLATLGNCCQLLATFDQFWVIFGNSWQLMVNVGNFWQLLATFANFWHSLLCFANFWQLLPIFVNFWQILPTFANFC